MQSHSGQVLAKSTSLQKQLIIKSQWFYTNVLQIRNKQTLQHMHRAVTVWELTRWQHFCARN